jgi:hypothetical protein
MGQHARAIRRRSGIRPGAALVAPTAYKHARPRITMRHARRDSGEVTFTEYLLPGSASCPQVRIRAGRKTARRLCAAAAARDLGLVAIGLQDDFGAAVGLVLEEVVSAGCLIEREVMAGQVLCA